MRRKVARILGLSAIAQVACIGCIPEATDQEIKAMCENLIKVRAEVDMSSEAELIAGVEESFKKEKKRLEDWKARWRVGPRR